MNTEIIFVELNIYEKNLSQLVEKYQSVHNNYTNSLRQKNKVEASILLKQLDSLNQEILMLLDDIGKRIEKINNDKKYSNYKNDIMKKRSDLNTLNDKMVSDEKKIKELMFDLIDLDGKNETFKLEHKSSVYYIFLYMLIIIILCIVMFKTISSVEPNRIETLILCLAIIVLLYQFRNKIFGAGESLLTTAEDKVEDIFS
jgi:hypothetical protein